MAVVTGDRYLESLVKFVEKHAGPLIEGTLVLKLNPIGLHYVQSRLEALSELEGLLSGAPVDYLRAYVSDLGDHRAIEQLRRILRLLPSLKVVSVLPPPARDPVPLSLLPFGRLKFLELRGCDLSTSAARGLLELRHTLEKIICHNSTDALRHIFASRISEIKDSSQWNRLSFVSCACNGLLLMDESLQLLPVVETLDLSRNRFAKVDHLRKCTRLKHLDLGFNQLRTVSSFAEVSCQIVKLVLRNNALTTLHGIENLKSLEGLDLSYNIISKFSDLEIIAGLPSLQNLWLEGNPLCGARWYREQVFSIFPHPHKLELDEKKISTREFWKRKIIIASRQKQPASFGFYSPAIGNAELQGIINTKRRKHSRLACIESEEQNINTGSDQESVSCENEMRSKEENIISDEEAADLMNRFELIKKERSSLWLQEFKEWLNHDSENFMDGNNHNMDTLNPDLEHYMKPKKRNPCVGESSRYVSDSVQASGDESSTNILDSDCSFADISSGFNAYQYFDQISEAGSKVFVNSMPLVGRTDTKKEEMKSFVSIRTGNSLFDTFSVPGGENKTPKISVVTNNAIDDIMESYTPSIGPGSPPHYQEDILHRRHNLEEEILQLSAESYSMASSDSNTSCSEDDFTEFGLLIPEGDQSLIEHFSERSGHLSVPRSEDKYYDKEHGINQATGNGVYLSDTHAEPIPGALKHTELDQLSQRWLENFSTGECDKQKADWSEKKTCRKKPKKRFVLLSQGNDNLDGENKDLAKLNGEFDLQKDSVGYERERQILYGSPQKSIDNKQTWDITITTAFSSNGVATPSGVQSSIFGLEDLIEDFFNCQIADLGVNETCTMCICCSYIVEQKSVCKEVEVAVLLSTEHKLYFLLIYSKNDGSGISLRLMACHQIEDVHIILVGLGLQLLRVYIERRTTYLFATRSIDKSRQLLSILHSFDLDPRKEKFSIKSFEQMQFELFEKQICGGSRISIFQYSMVLFWCNNMKEDLWLSRSLFVLKEHLFLCIEEFVQFGFLSEDTASPYFLPDSCCSIVSVSDMVIDTRVDWCLILTIDCTSKFCTSHKTKKIQDAGPTEKQPVSGSLIWKLKWFSEGSLFNFVALLKAIHAGVSSSPLLVRCVS